MILCAIFFTASSGPAPEAFVNEGRRLIQNGAFPAGILEYRRGLREYPSNKDLQQDLLTARTLVEERRDVPTAPGFDGLHHRRSRGFMFLGFAANVLIAAFAAVRWLTDRPRWAFAMLIIAILATLIQASIAYSVYAQPQYERAITIGVVARDAPLREGNGDSYPQKLDLPAGLEVVVLNERGGWVQVELSNGVIGWIKLDNLLR